MRTKLTVENAFFCLKLKTGETLFTEVIDVDEVAMTVFNPMLVISDIKSQGDTLSLTPWIPYTVRKAIPVPMHMIYFADNLNQTFFEYYGRTVIQFEINKIKQRVFEQMESRDDFITMSDGLEEMKKVSEELVLKFGVEGPDFSDFEAVLQSHKDNLQLH